MPRSSALHIAPDAPIPGVDLEGFFQIPNIMAVKAIRAKLTAADLHLWLYLQAIDPYGDSMKDLPSIGEIAQAIGVSERQVKRSLSNLETAGFYSYEVLQLRGQNLAGSFAKNLSKSRRTKKESSEKKETAGFSEQDKFVQPMTNLSEQDKFVQPMTDLSSGIYIDRARDQTIQNKRDLKKTYSEEADAPPPQPDVIEVEIVQEASQPTVTSFVESEDGTHSINAIAIEDQSEPPRDTSARFAKLWEIEKHSSTPQNFPWKEEDGISFRKEMIDAVYDSNRTWYSLPNGSKNKTAIIARLRTLEKNLKKQNDTAITSWNDLQNYWESAVTLIPEVQQVKEAFDEKEREEARARRRSTKFRFTA